MQQINETEILAMQINCQSSRWKWLHVCTTSQRLALYISWRTRRFSTAPGTEHLHQLHHPSIIGAELPDACREWCRLLRWSPGHLHSVQHHPPPPPLPTQGLHTYALRQEVQRCEIKDLGAHGLFLSAGHKTHDNPLPLPPPWPISPYTTLHFCPTTPTPHT